MAILTNSGRAAAAMAVKAQPIHMAWGSGNPDWDLPPSTPSPDPGAPEGDSTPPESVEATALLNELGRRRATQVLFCVPDQQGELVVPTGRFTASATPTKYLYMRFAFDFTDAQASTIRELAICIGTVAKATVPAGQDYLIPSDLQDPGLLLALENIPKLVRSASVRQQFEFVIQF